MERRRLGRTEHDSSVAILGGVMFAATSPSDTERGIRMALDAGVNHLDIAPTYGDAEANVGPFIPAARQRLFIACKTTERTRAGAREELERSLTRLRVEQLDLYQFHAVLHDEDAEALLAPGGAAETVLAAKEEGLARFVGITAHFQHAPRIFLRVLEELDLDTVMFPVNAALWGVSEYRRDAERLLEVCAERDLGVQAIKVGSGGFWHGEEQRQYQPWYKPLDQEDGLGRAFNFTLSLPVHGATTPGDLALLPASLAAANGFTRLTPAELEAEIAATPYEPLVEPAP